MKHSQKITTSIIYMGRKFLYNTPVSHWRFSIFVYDKLFSLTAPNLKRPIKFRGAPLYVDPQDRSYLPALVGGYYEEYELSVFDNIIKDCNIFFDIGSNIGMYSILGSLKNPALKTYAFEPVKNNQKILEKNLILNKLTNRVSVVKKAVSNKKSQTVIYLSEKSSGIHSLTNKVGSKTQKIETISVDSFCKEKKIKPDIIKIDVEGHEASVLRGAKFILQQKPTIFMEYIPHINHRIEEILESLEAIYPFCYVVDEIKVKISKVETRNLDRYHSYNLIFAQKIAHIKEIEKFIQ